MELRTGFGGNTPAFFAYTQALVQLSLSKYSNYKSKIKLQLKILDTAGNFDSINQWIDLLPSTAGKYFIFGKTHSSKYMAQ